MGLISAGKDVTGEINGKIADSLPAIENAIGGTEAMLDVENSLRSVVDGRTSVPHGTLKDKLREEAGKFSEA